uniref:Uncharacterized protein n=1 Tax=Glossina brevipalpis TaxID=37001 RepID=A0A1A9VZZ4_9MUSC
MNQFRLTFPIDAASRREILSTISLDVPIREIRRKTGPIYDVLIQELIETNCLYTANMFSKLASKESCLRAELIINHSFSEQPGLLLSLFDNVKAAELAYLLKKDQSIIFAQLYESIVLLEGKIRQFHWLFFEIYRIILNLCEKIPSISHNTDYQKCRIFYKYGIYLTTYGSDLAEAVRYLNRALQMSVSKPWYVRDGDEVLLMKEKICNLVSSELGKQGYTLMLINANSTEKLIRAVLSCVSQVGISDHRALFVKNNAMLIECLMTDNKYEEALSHLKFLSAYITTDKDRQSQKNMCIYKYLKGKLLFHFEKIDEAIESLTEAEKISRRGSFKTLHAYILTQLGNVSSNKRLSCGTQMAFYQNAQQVYKEINDPVRAKNAFYKSIETKVTFILPTIIHVIKNSKNVKVDMHRLRRWKFLCQPFWEDVQTMTRQNEGDKLLFLLEENKN